MTKENNAAVLVLLTNANLKNLEFRKKKILLSIDFLQKFSKFSRKSEFCKKCSLKAIRSN